MTTTASLPEEQAAQFTTEVRSQLADLPREELDELLDGLQADVTDRLTDGGELGDPSLYAAELRQAAGLPPRTEATTEAASNRRSMRVVLGEAGTGWAQRVSHFFDATPARQGIRDFVLSLRPVWWITRGFVLTGIAFFMMGASFAAPSRFSLPALVFMTGVVIVSVQWGRGKWAPNRWLVTLRRALSTIAVLALLPMTGLVSHALSTPTYIDTSPMYPGLMADGAPVTNVFAYDCAGQPIEGVQLFDQDGNPLNAMQGNSPTSHTGWDDVTQEAIVYFPNGAVIGNGMWNVFPLKEARWSATEDPYAASPVEQADRAMPAVWPFGERGPLNAGCAVQSVDVGADSDARTEKSADTDADATSATGADADHAAAPKPSNSGAEASGTDSVTTKE